MLDRRAFLVGMASVVVAPLAGEPQPATKVWRIGYLTPAESPRATLVDALRELGYVDGQTARLEVRGAKGDLGRLSELAADLVQAQVDVIIAVSPPAIVAARRATRTIPVVMAFWGG